MAFDIQYINSRVYETTVDTATQQSGALYKQTNNAIPVIGYMMARYHGMNYKQIVAMVQDIFKDVSEPVQTMGSFPLVHDGAFYDSETDGNRVTEDQVCNYTVVYGWRVETRCADPNEPIIVQGDTSPEAIRAARAAALTPYIVTRPFMLAFPETGRYMFEIRVDHAPSGAVTYWDSSIKEQAPDGMSEMSMDPLAKIFSEEDRERRQQLFELWDKLKEAGKNPADPELVVKTLAQEWCPDVSTYYQKLNELQMPWPQDEPIVYLKPPFSEEDQFKLDTIHGVFRELMDASEEKTIYIADVLKTLAERGHDWFETGYALDRFIKSHNPPPPTPEEIEEMHRKHAAEHAAAHAAAEAAQEKLKIPAQVTTDAPADGDELHTVTGCTHGTDEPVQASTQD